MDKESLKPVIESLIFSSDSALSFEKLASVLEGEDRAMIKEALNELVGQRNSDPGFGLCIEEVAGGFQFRTKAENSPWIRRLFKIGAQKISKAAMESLAIIAYKQPLTRGELEAIRGVDSGGVIATLMDRRFVKITGRKDAPGRPVVYGTTKEFLETFDLKDLSCLPSLKDLKLLEEENAAKEIPSEEEPADKGREEDPRAPEDPDSGTGTETPGPGSSQAEGCEAPESKDAADRGAEAPEDNS